PQLRLEPADPAGDLLQRLVAGQVHVDRRDRDMAAAHRVEVGARPGVLFGARGTDPPPGAPAGIVLLYARLCTVAVAQARHFETAHLRPRDVRDVDVEDGVGRERIDLQPGDDLDRRARGRLVVFAAVVAGGQRHRHGG